MDKSTDTQQLQLIVTDSLSVLTALGNSLNRITEIANLAREVRRRQHKTKLLWVPGHNGITGNERADHEAKTALELNVPTNATMADIDAVHIVNKSLKQTKKHVIQNIPRPHQVAISRWRMGYTRRSHGHKIEKTNPPKCETCNAIITTTHDLFECSKYAAIRMTTGLQPEHLNGSKEETERLYMYLRETVLLAEL
jgi:RNase H